VQHELLPTEDISDEFAPARYARKYSQMNQRKSGNEGLACSETHMKDEKKKDRNGWENKIWTDGRTERKEKMRKFTI
jgi:hypothetical protein